MSQDFYNVLNNFPQEKYNLLIPVQSIQEINPIYRIVINQVNLSTDLADKDIYEEKQAKSDNNQKMYAITHKGLLKLVTAANGQVIETVRVKSKVCENCIDIAKGVQKAPQCGNCAARNNVAMKVTMKFPELSGGWRIVQATREYDFTSFAGKDGQISKMKEFAGEHVESKAMSRCIRKGLSIKSAYTMVELKKPFVVAYPVLDAKDSDVKKALIAGSIASSNLLFGSGFALNPGQQALTEGKPDEQPERNIDKSTGEIIEADYECEQPEEDMPEQEPDRHFCGNPQCGDEISAKISAYSIEKFGGPLCYKCQQARKKEGKAS